MSGRPQLPGLVNAPQTESPDAPDPCNALLWVIGQNPGLNEDRANEPFIGACGKLLRSHYLARLDLNHNGIACYISNAVRCYTASNASPTFPQSRACAPYLTADAHRISLAYDHRLLILALGAVAIRTICMAVGAPNQRQSLGWWLERQGHAIRFPGAPQSWSVFTSYHPGALLRNDRLYTQVADHMMLLRNVLTGRTPPDSTPVIVEPRPFAESRS